MGCDFSMSLTASAIYFSLGFLIAFIFPRLPIIVITRGKGFNSSFPEHPFPVPLSPKLTQRVLNLRMIYWMGFIVALIPLMFGFASLRWGNTPFGFGLWLSSGWFIISRLQVFIGGPSPPWTLDMAQRLQTIMDGSKSAKSCCANPKPEWRIINIACDTCSTILDDIPRPDLGRKRMDGFFVGGFRLLLSDGHPVIAGDENNRLRFTDSEE
tara:strand:- start:85 stop:717 length:633 start_codon:yes stop_codon:yes gene_type:complete